MASDDKVCELGLGLPEVVYAVDVRVLQSGRGESLGSVCLCNFAHMH